jgi:thiamine pyrophosphate-dependent acetolactate synthase large subunit-like protein
MSRSELPSLAATDIFGTRDMTQKLTGGRAIVHSLLSHGVDTVFGIPGVQTCGFFDALHEARDRIRVLYPRHEQATAYMAFGYAKTTGRGRCRRSPSARGKAPAAVAEAFRQMSTGRSRPVGLEMPWEVFGTPPWGLLMPPAKRNDR